jgi:Terminase RNaseH-like domain
MSKWVCNLTWEDAPHLTEEMKQEMLSGLMPHEIDMRAKGLPTLGHGAIYPVRESDITIEPFRIPDTWPRAYGMDVGYDHPTAVIWGAYNEREDVWYLYSEHKLARSEPAIHADAIRSRGVWIPGLIDCHSNRHSEAGALGLMEMYTKLGLNIQSANNGPGTVEPSILEIYQRMSSGRLKVFRHLLGWFEEFRIYRRDDKGNIVKLKDDLMDATRYLIMSGKEVAEKPPEDELEELSQFKKYNQGQSPVCGY